jgi:hypothetical protein
MIEGKKRGHKERKRVMAKGDKKMVEGKKQW